MDRHGVLRRWKLSRLGKLEYDVQFYSPHNSLKMKPGPLDEAYIAIMLREMLNGLDYLHSTNKLHRDIKGKDARVDM